MKNKRRNYRIDTRRLAFFVLLTAVICVAAAYYVLEGLLGGEFAVRAADAHYGADAGAEDALGGGAENGTADGIADRIGDIGQYAQAAPDGTNFTYAHINAWADSILSFSSNAKGGAQWPGPRQYMNAIDAGGVSDAGGVLGAGGDWDAGGANEGAGPEAPENVVVTLSAIGDCTIGYDETFGYQNRFDQVYAANDKDPAYFFGNVRDILAGDDITVANLETVFTDSNKKASKTFRFKGPPEYVKILEEGGVEIVNIANNHIYDYLQKGYDDTVETLNNSRVRYFGYGKYEIMEIRGVKIGFAGFHIGGGGWSHQKKAVTDALGELRNGADLVVISFHWGLEGHYKPSGDQRSLARYCIDNGADLVLGHHPHTLQNMEEYNGRTVVYSLGNFCFGGNRNPSDKDTIIFQQAFEFDGSDHSLLTARTPEIIPASVSSVKDRNDYRPTPVSGADAERVLRKVNNTQ